jgi:hypothetical protein
MGIHSAVVRATGRAVVFGSRAHLVWTYKVVCTGDPLAKNFSKCGFLYAEAIVGM